MKCVYCGGEIKEIEQRWAGKSYLACEHCTAPIEHTLQVRFNCEIIEIITIETAYRSVEDELERISIYGKLH